MRIRTGSGVRSLCRSNETAITFGAAVTNPSIRESSMIDELPFVDDFLSKWDRFAQGENELVPFLREHGRPFEAALARLLKAKDQRAPARMVFYPVVQIGGHISIDSELGKAAALVLGADFPITT